MKFYWPHDDDRASTGAISVYRRPGQALLIITRDAPNNYAGPSTAVVEIDRQALGLPIQGALASYDMESRGRTPLGQISGNTLEVPVDVDNFVAILIRTKEQ